MKISELLKIKYPIFQGGMANISTGSFAAEVSQSGALGIIGAGGMSVEELRREIRLCKSLTSRPFGVNLILLNKNIDELAELVIEEGVEIVTTGAGNPSRFLPAWKENKIKVFPVVPTIGLARRMEDLGVDGLILEGLEAGGHIGEITSLDLISRAGRELKTPIIAAGGIGSGRDILAMEVLGASGVQLGTLFLATEECPIHPNYKEAIIKARERSTIVVGRKAGIATRVIKNPMTREYLKREEEGASKEELENFMIGSLKRAVKEGDRMRGSLMAGTVISQIEEIKPIRLRIEELVEEYKKEWEKFCGKI